MIGYRVWATQTTPDGSRRYLYYTGRKWSASKHDCKYYTDRNRAEHARRMASKLRYAGSPLASNATVQYCTWKATTAAYFR